MFIACAPAAKAITKSATSSAVVFFLIIKTPFRFELLTPYRYPRLWRNCEAATLRRFGQKNLHPAAPDEERAVAQYPPNPQDTETSAENFRLFIVFLRRVVILAQEPYHPLQKAGEARGNMLLSIVTVCLNAEQLIGRTIDSVLRQDVDDYEYLIVDGASADRTLAIAESYRPAFDEKGIRYAIVSERHRHLQRHEQGGAPGVRRVDHLYERGRRVFLYGGTVFLRGEWMREASTLNKFRPVMMDGRYDAVAHKQRPVPRDRGTGL
jgi:hypothetical protein